MTICAYLILLRNSKGIRNYSEAVKVKVALDNGDIIGVSAGEYLKSTSKTREIETPARSLETSAS